MIMKKDSLDFYRNDVTIYSPDYDYRLSKCVDSITKLKCYVRNFY